MDLSELNLDIRAFNAVCRAGFKTAEELFQAMGENQESVRLLVGRSNFDRIDEAFAELEDKGMLDHPELSCEYHEFRMYARDDRPWMYATLDGELTETETGRRGIYEGKTTSIMRPEQWDEWDGCIPPHYYVQILHQLLACEWADFAVLFACIRYTAKDGERRMMMREYRIERAEVADDLAWLLWAEQQFWHKITNDIEPPDMLPEI